MCAPLYILRPDRAGGGAGDQKNTAKTKGESRKKIVYKQRMYKDTIDRDCLIKTFCFIYFAIFL